MFLDFLTLFVHIHGIYTESSCAQNTPPLHISRMSRGKFCLLFFGLKEKNALIKA
jgi:hypothetical protein